MSDYFFNRYYNEVKDSEWPLINSYTEFLKLPEKIVTECVVSHNLTTRLAQLEDKNYWWENSSCNQVYVFENVGYVPTYKCASTTFKRIFKHMGWVEKKLTDIDTDEFKLFGLMLNPHYRRVKGIVESLAQSYNHDYLSLLKDLELECFRKFISKVSFTDAHTFPYSICYGKFFNQINWIPLDFLSNNDLICEIENFTQIKLPEIPKLNHSNFEKKEIFSLVESLFLTNEPSAEFESMFCDDIKTYNQLIVHYKNFKKQL